MKYFKSILGIILCLFACTAHATMYQEPVEAQEILDYWFGPLQTFSEYPKDKAKIWFSGGEEIDKEIANRFEKLVIAAKNHELDEWKESPRGRLALIILLDQFSRNIYRGTPEAFANDGFALDLALEGLLQSDDQTLYPIERVFFYLPFEHAEDMKMQKISVMKFHEIVLAVPSAQRSNFAGFEEYAWKHYKIIEKFGRYPHRNAILNRESTAEEIEFLKGPDSSF